MKPNNLIENIKITRPLILNFTNYVTMNFVADGLLSLGASPLMCNAEQEIDDLVKISSAVVINLGTLNNDFIYLCELACKAANKLNKPIILDPVGTGASKYRSTIATKLITNYKIAIVKGNANEIISLAESSSGGHGVDSYKDSSEAIQSAHFLSKKINTCIVVSGKMDLIIDGDQIKKLHSGSALMTMITGTGCLLTAVIAAFHSVENNRWDAAATATLFYGKCGAMATKDSLGSGDFKSRFLNRLSQTFDVTTEV
jgi:hydroxyethylthiazole kinase